jgi:hypothetical protein
MFIHTNVTSLSRQLIDNSTFVSKPSSIYSDNSCGTEQHFEIWYWFIIGQFK